MKLRIIYFSIICANFVALNSCTGGYSFTGADIDANIKTITIEYFQNRASLVQPNLSNVFTETLKDKFVSQTNLELINYNGDLKLQGEITNYNVTAQSFQGNETAALNRLSITVRVKYTNSIEPDKNFDTSFSRYADFESSQSLSAVETSLIQEISEELVIDIFNKAVANW
ncbi:MAG: LptE family protein [Bacteroidales bacterium]|nr:LptE family protein [Bacteroidales bacterium]